MIAQFIGCLPIHLDDIAQLRVSFGGSTDYLDGLHQDWPTSPGSEPLWETGLIAARLFISRVSVESVTVCNNIIAIYEM